MQWNSRSNLQKLPKQTVFIRVNRDDRFNLHTGNAAHSHGRRKDFFQVGATRGFSKIFPGGAKVTKFAFYQSKLRKQLFFAEIFKIHEGAKALPCPVFPTPMLTAKYQPSIPNYTILGVDG